MILAFSYGRIGVGSLSLEGSLPTEIQFEGGGQTGARLAFSVKLVSEIIVQLPQRHEGSASSSLTTGISFASRVRFRKKYQIAGCWWSLSLKEKVYFKIREFVSTRLYRMKKKEILRRDSRSDAGYKAGGKAVHGRQPASQLLGSAAQSSPEPDTHRTHPLQKALMHNYHIYC